MAWHSGLVPSNVSACLACTDLDELQELISELVAIESVNPDLVPLGAGEAAIAGYVDSWLRSAGLEVTVVEPVQGRPSVVTPESSTVATKCPPPARRFVPGSPTHGRTAR